MTDDSYWQFNLAGRSLPIFRKEIIGGNFLNVLAIGVGGFFGAILRNTIGILFSANQVFPLGTLTINLLGCFFLAFFLNIANESLKISPVVKLGIGTGFIGSFTTFSTFSVETLNLINNNQFFLVLTYLFFSVVGGVGLAITGNKLGERTTKQYRALKGD